MRQGLHDIDWEYAGATLAQASNKEQVTFLRAFVKEALSWGTRQQVEMQLAFVNEDLTSEERRVLSMLSYDEQEIGGEG